jgi:hypothetical protein
MIQVPQIDELTFEGVYGRGIPNEERIVLRPKRRIVLAEYILCLGLKMPAGVVPLRDNMFWFGEEITVEPPYRIFVYTGPGVRRFTTTKGSSEPALVLHWGKPGVVLESPLIEPVLFYIGSMLTPSSSSLEDLLGTLTPSRRAARTSEGVPPDESGSLRLLLEAAIKAEQGKK